MTIFGMIMGIVTMGWTLFMLLVITILGDIYIFLRGPGVLTFVIGYVAIILIYITLKRLAQD